MTMMPWTSLCWLAAGSLLFGLVTRGAMPVVAWLALFLLLHASRAFQGWHALPLLWTALYLTFVVSKRGVLPMSGAAFWFVVAAEAGVMTLPFAVDRFVAPRLSGVAATLVFPLALTTIEFLQSRLTSAASWGSIAYAEYGLLPVMQLAAVTGLWGITFLIAWVASTLDFVWQQGPTSPEIRLPAALCGLAVVSAFAFGTVRLLCAPTDGPAIRVATLNRPRGLFAPGELTRIAEGRVAPDDRARIDGLLARLHAWFLEGSRREARAGATLIAWPEQNLLVFGSGEAAFLERARQVAVEERVFLAMGLGTIHLGEPLPLENKLLLIDPSGQVVMTHRKTRAVAGWEAGIMRRGEEGPVVVSTTAGRIGGLICYEADFPPVFRELGRQHADLAVLPVNDWREIRDTHMQMHAFRAIENGLAIVRPAASGLSSAVDAWGRTLALADFFAPGDGTMVAQLPRQHVPTLYARWGDWFAWLCAAALVLTLAAALR